MSKSINLKITKDGSVFLIEENGPVKREREIEPQSLLTLIEKSLHNEVTDAYGSRLPKNCVFYGVVERHAQQPTQIVMLERDKCIRPYNHFGAEETVGYPKLIFAYKVQGQHVITTSVVAAKDEVMTPESAVYHFPYANVGASGAICLGSYSYPEVKDISDMSYFPEPFYLIEHTHANNGAGQVVREILDQVQEKPFDDELLEHRCTFEQFINNFAS